LYVFFTKWAWIKRNWRYIIEEAYQLDLVFVDRAGPWRRDFENGFVLVNPLNKAYTFTYEELTGDLY